MENNGHANDLPEDSPLDPELGDVSLLRPWERLTRESNQQHLLFTMYRDMCYGDPDKPGLLTTPTRSIALLAERLGMSKAHMYELSGTYSWAQRAGAWDRYVQKRKDSAGLAEAVRWRIAQVRQLEKLSNLAEIELNKWQAKALEGQTNITIKEIVGIFELVYKRQALLTGEPTEHTKQSGEIDFSKLSREDLEALDSLRKKARA